MKDPLHTIKETLSALQRPFEEFLRLEAAGGLVLLAATLLALGLANSPWADAYHHLWELPLSLGVGGATVTRTLHHWINDGLMAVFFFVVGLELKRELLVGELAELRTALLPAAAALGGMLLPALLFHLLAPAGPEARGWGIPMATDIAFALGVVALLGQRIPRAAAVFLTALAIVDDLGAVLVIALFYSADLSLPHLAAAGGCFALLVAGNRLGLRSPNFYALIGLGLWAALLGSGIHASIAGVLIGATIPIRARSERPVFLAQAQGLLSEFRQTTERHDPLHTEEQLRQLLALEQACHDAMSPLQRMEHVMHDWVIFGVMPLFALANAGISLSGDQLLAALTHPVTHGVIAGLVVGKPLGIVLFAWLAVRLGLCRLPNGTSWRHIVGVGLLGGIGFTMSLFIASLAYEPAVLTLAAKVGIFIASLVAGTAGYGVLAWKGEGQKE